MAVDYQYPWDELIGRWKFGGETGWSAFWASLMWQNVQARALWRTCDVVVPVPISPQGLALRGFNQSWELVKALQRLEPGPASLAQALLRTREVPTQHSLPRRQRLENLAGVFAAHPDAGARLRQAHVLLIDDVRTTGATLEAAAAALLQSGAAKVSALVLARTPDST